MATYHDLKVGELMEVGLMYDTFKLAIELIATYLGHSHSCMCDLCLARMYIHVDGSGHIEMDEFDGSKVPGDIRRIFKKDWSWHRAWEDGTEVVKELYNTLNAYASIPDKSDLNNMEW